MALISHTEKIQYKIGKLKAYSVFLKTKRQVPAYKKFLQSVGYKKMKFNGIIPNLTCIPIIDKESYIKKYSIEDLCINGKIPSKDIIIDESSGSSGIPTNWIRSKRERQANKRMLHFGLRELLGKNPIFIINAFALGPWATGINITMAFSEIAILKSIGPDAEKIKNTLLFFGKSFHYVIMGYPPFLKSIVDTIKINWKEYHITMIYGGEGISEPMRNYILEKGIRKVYGSFGASDLELNIAAENDFTIELRKLLIQNKELAQRLIQHTGSAPLIFQFNPIDFFIETNKEGELIISLCRPYYISPKIRYNIHDTGHVISFSELVKILKDFEINPADISSRFHRLPLLFHYGRSDMSVSYFGCKLTPIDIQETIMQIPEIAPIINSFTLITYEDTQATKNLMISFELQEGHLINEINSLDKIKEKILQTLSFINQDFRESIRITPLNQKPIIEFHVFQTGPFSQDDIRLKHKYIQKK